MAGHAPVDRADDLSDSGLACPWCGYNLTGCFVSDRCPECGRRFVLRKPVKLVPRPGFWSLKFTTSSGLTCPGCGNDPLGFAARVCRHCGRKYTLYERVFGTGVQRSTDND